MFVQWYEVQVGGGWQNAVVFDVFYKQLPKFVTPYRHSLFQDSIENMGCEISKSAFDLLNTRIIQARS
jgi:hypothetical protein